MHLLAETIEIGPNAKELIENSIIAVCICIGAVFFFKYCG